MVKNLITPGQTLRRIMAREVAPSYIFLGEDSFFHELIINGILNIFEISRISWISRISEDFLGFLGCPRIS